MLGLVHLATLSTSTLPDRTGLIVLYVAFVTLAVILLLVVLFARWPGGGDDPEDSGSGPGTGPPPPGPDPGPGGDPAWWGDFEREFARHVARRTPRDRSKTRP
jgi:hypothetical protein